MNVCDMFELNCFVCCFVHFDFFNVMLLFMFLCCGLGMVSVVFIMKVQPTNKPVLHTLQGKLHEWLYVLVNYTVADLRCLTCNQM